MGAGTSTTGGQGDPAEVTPWGDRGSWDTLDKDGHGGPAPSF